MNFTDETYEEAHIPGVGVRIDYNMTPRDAIEGVFMEITAADNASTAAPTAFGGTLQVDTLTFPAKAAIGDSDYFIVTDTNLDEWAVAAQLYPAAIAQSDTLQFAAVAGMTDGEYVIITDQSGQEWAVAADLTGASAAPTGARWAAIGAAFKAQVDLSLAVTEENVSDAFMAAFNALVNFNVAVTLSDEATDGLVGVLQVVAGACAEPESLLADDSAAGSVTVAQITDGKDATVAPTGARWAAIPAGQKAQCDLSAAVTAADVAAAVELIFDGLAGVIVATDDSAADGTMTFTQAARGVVVNPEMFNADDTGVGTITTAPTTPGVASAVDAAADTITMSSDPGWATGKKVVLTTTGAAPTGLTSGNTYYVISLGAGIYQFASSLANALAGTEIDITDQGAAGSTITLTTAASTIGYLFNSMHKLTDTQINTAISTDGFYDLNLADDDSYMIAQLGFDFSVQKKNRLFIKPAETFDGFTIPDQLLPHLTLRIDDPTIKISDIKISRRGVN